MDLKLPLNTEILTSVSKLDQFRGSWSVRPPASKDRLQRFAEAARVQSIGASSRLAGIHVTDAEVASLIGGEAIPHRDAGEIVGYAAALREPLPGADTLLDAMTLRELHARIVNGDAPTPWRSDPMHRESFDADGKATGIVFPSLPPRLIESKTEELLTWFELEMRTTEQHPVLVVGTFVLYLFAICPFYRGNGRLARLLTSRLLERAGYGFMPYASLEAETELRRDEYHHALLTAQTHLWTDEGKLGPWFAFLLGCLVAHRERVENKIALERQASDYPPLQRAILEAVREHGDVDAALLLHATGANRNTLKDNLRRMVRGGVLEKIGERRGTRYRMATGRIAGASVEGTF